jgi:phospholipase/carboxylesterase
MIFSGFIPTVERWQPDLARTDMPLFIAHGRRDPVIGVGFAHTARDTLERAGFTVDYHESDAGHHIDPQHVPRAVEWLSQQL